MGMYIGPQKWWVGENIRSLRFNSADSAYLSRTPATAGNRKTWTWAGWVKRSKLGTNQALIHCRVSANTDDTSIAFTTSDTLRVVTGASDAVVTNAVFRDVSSWYHIICAFDTTQATAANRIKLYINGVEQTYSATSYPSLNSDWSINSTSAHNIGRYNVNVFPADFYLADVHFIDGTALDPTNFGYFDEYGVWQPKTYFGDYGTNGFRLNFGDNTSTTTLGLDSSGKGNNWTANNLSVTAGAGNDSSVDHPLNYGVDTGVGGEVRGNYCTWNPLDVKTTIALSNGNLDLVGSSDGRTRGTISMPTGKWYWEITATAVPISDSNHVCIWSNNVALSNDTYRVVYRSDGAYVVGGTLSTGWASWTTGDVIGVTFDADTRETKFYKNNTLQGTVTAPALPIGSAYTPAVILAGTNSGQTANFGQRQFAYQAPEGFKALCTANLPAPTIEDPSTVMDVALYQGNGGTNTISGLNFSPDFVWIKNRPYVYDHVLFDAVRGTTKILKSNSTAAESTQSTSLTSFNSDGFTLGADGSGEYNFSSVHNYVAWCWDAGSSTVTNTDGSITSSVRANPSAGFSIVTYTGNGSTGTVGHGLGASPAFYVVKARNASDAWYVYHSALGNTKYLRLNATDAEATSTVWNNAGPSSTTFSVLGGGVANISAQTYVAYCFAPVSGYSAMSSYVSTGTSDNAFQYCGFRPRFVLLKNAANNWIILDAARSTFNAADDWLGPSSSSAEDSNNSAYAVDFLSNGFKVRSGNGILGNSGNTVIWAAFAENPFRSARAR